MNSLVARGTISAFAALFLSSANAEESESETRYVTGAHTFLSAKQEADTILYEVCNRGADSSTFFWRGARFGVDAKSRLPSNYCVKKRYSPIAHDEVAREFSTVVSRDWVDSSVPTLVHCPAREVNEIDRCELDLLESVGKLVLELEIIGQEPDGPPYSISNSQFLFEQGDGDIIVSAFPSVGIDAMLFVLPESDLEPQGLADLIAVLDGEPTFGFLGDVLAELGYVDDTDFEGADQRVVVFRAPSTIRFPLGSPAGGEFVPVVLSNGIMLASEFLAQFGA